MNSVTLPLKVPGFGVRSGDILRSNAHVLACPVNCRPGVMGKGLAKAFAEAFPGIRATHATLCQQGDLHVGRPILVSAVQGDREQQEPGIRNRVVNVLLFPTKDHWEHDSRIDWIFRGLASAYATLADYRTDLEEVRLAFPALGCGLGGLPFDAVAAMLRVWSAGLPERFITNLYLPH